MRQQLLVQADEDGTTVRVSGRLDSTSCGSLRTALHDALARGTGNLVIDADGLEIWGSAALGVLIGASRAARRLDRQIVILGLSARELRLVRASHLHRLMVVGPLSEIQIPDEAENFRPA